MRPIGNRYDMNELTKISIESGYWHGGLLFCLGIDIEFR